MASWKELKDEGDEFVQWAESKPKLIRIDTQQVPRGVLPSSIKQTLILHDLRVKVRFGPDDAVYDRNEDLRKRLARGNLVLRVTGNDSSSQEPPPGCYLLLYALRKFTGGCGDDDDRDGGNGGGDGGDAMWRRYFSQPIDSTARIVRTRKANGEAFHLSAVKIQGHVLLLGGSKNTHLMFTEQEHIQMYTEGRYRVARDFCSDFLHYFRQLPEENQSGLIQYLLDNNATAVFEILYEDHQHVELLTNEKPLPRFITFTSNRTSHSQSVTLLPPDRALEIASGFGLDCIQHQVITMQQFDSACAEIRRGYGYEGEVLYFMDSEDSVIGLLKKKTAWYILVRALREKLKSVIAACKKASSFDQKEQQGRIDRRIREIQTWLQLDDAVVQKWMHIGQLALRRCVQQMSAGNGSQFERLIHERFPVFWQQFVQEAGISDTVLEADDS